MKVVSKWLAVSGNGDVKVLGRRPNARTINPEWMVFPLNITIPDGWGEIRNDLPINLTLPDATDAMVTIGALDDIIGGS